MYHHTNLQLHKFLFGETGVGAMECRNVFKEPQRTNHPKGS